METYDSPGEARLLKVILGKSFQPETNITVGSTAILLKNLLEERGHDVEMYDPHVDSGSPLPAYPASVFLIGTRDPWRYIPQRPGVKVVSVGRAPSNLEDGA